MKLIKLALNVHVGNIPVLNKLTDFINQNYLPLDGPLKSVLLLSHRSFGHERANGGHYALSLTAENFTSYPMGK